jgi:hypothetical protein
MLLALTNNQLNLWLGICGFLLVFIPIVWSKYIFNEHPKHWYLKLKWGSIVLLIPALFAIYFTNKKDELNDEIKDSTFVNICNTVDVKFKHIPNTDSLKLIIPFCSSDHIHGLKVDLAFISRNFMNLQLYNLGKSIAELDFVNNAKPTITTNSFHISEPLTSASTLILYIRLNWENHEPNRDMPENVFLLWSGSDSTFNYLNDKKTLEDCKDLLKDSKF